jgi:hypothetical protein
MSSGCFFCPLKLCGDSPNHRGTALRGAGRSHDRIIEDESCRFLVCYRCMGRLLPARCRGELGVRACTGGQVGVRTVNKLAVPC